MTPDEVAEFLVTLPGCKRKGTSAVPAWYVDNRIVARLIASDELMIRCAFDVRERLVTDHPDTFGVPPSYDAHMKVQAMLYGDSGAIQHALRQAWEMQRSS
ncbi:hypothetical protein GCM10011492_32940 [Flexivirga endophytica]|uniref:MmcQ/YjbR family DNA-binding protein n=1 Tax=Flexivirga endophytica TaxID=1849103 RepID=A0A916WYE1_9MICO|nr:hypothetical protein [Flexivirga endophytica]GGB39552.1 hypothetical protein GCM10011492_32940 [Flexivirga endophytica]GHB47477.1 hypothetical protein GCM10008112_15330 [Flexivirga endophytica]